MMTKEVYIKLVNFMTTRDGAVVLRCRHIGDTLKILISLIIFYLYPRHKTKWVMMSKEFDDPQSLCSRIKEWVANGYRELRNIPFKICILS